MHEKLSFYSRIFPDSPIALEIIHADIIIACP